MHKPSEVKNVLDLHKEGLNQSQISQLTGISRTSIRSWVRGEVPNFPSHLDRNCPSCVIHLSELDHASYSYLLGLYLGDGCISIDQKGVARLRIVCADEYPELIFRCEQAISSVLPNSVGRARKIGCTEVSSYSKHWFCLFPQHGPGRKHERKIELAGWQQEIIDSHPKPLIEGLIHSDGCKVLNWVNGTAYPRYHFTNASDDIRRIFTDACDSLGISWTQNNPRVLSVARRQSVELMDAFITPKA